MSTETQASIVAWMLDTFGDTATNLRIAVRMNEEMSELMSKLAVNDNDRAAAEEMADIVITACRMMDRLGVDLSEEITRKMAINRKRTWKLDGTGCGQHE